MKKFKQWVKEPDRSMMKRAIKDHSFYKGLEVKTECIKISPDGEFTVANSIRVTIQDLIIVEQNDPYYVDCS